MKKITLFALMLVLVATLAVLFVVSTSADDTITVTYQWFNGNVWETAKPNEDGSYTLRATKKSGNSTVTLADGTVVDKVFYGWYTKDGTIYEPGATVKFTESTVLYEAYGVEVDNIADFKAVKTNKYVRLGADLVMDEELKSDWGASVYDLNGHTLTVTNNNHALYNYRGAFAFIGKGTIIHQPVTVNTRDDQTGGIIFQHHSYGDWDTMQRCFIGKDITFETPYNLFRITGNPNYAGCPDMHIAGTIKAKNFMYCGSLDGATIKFYDTTSLTLTGNQPFKFTNQGATNKYADISLRGTITLTNPDAVLFDDFLMSNKFSIATITSGAYTVSSTDAERIAMYLPNTLMLKATENADGTTTYNVVEADCVHNWELNLEETVAPTPDTTGIDAFVCSKCQAEKKVVTVYAPSEVEITIKVRTEEGEKEYTVLAGDVLDFQFNGFGAAAVCYIAGVKSTDEFTAEQIISIEIPNTIKEFTGFANATIEEIVITDASNILVKDLSLMTGLKNVKIGAATVKFSGISKQSTIEAVTSYKEGAKVTFASNAFNGSKIKDLNMCAGSTYIFEQNAFSSSGLTKVIFPDNSTVQFSSYAAFYGCANLSYVYFGLNCISDKKINNKPFDCCYAIETVVLMDIVYINEYTFCCNGDYNSNGSYKEGKGEYKEAIKVYSHNPDITFHQNVFANRGVLGVNLYTAGTGVTSLLNCKYTIYSGLAHPYSLETVVESTCVTQGDATYVTSCPCGIEYRESAYTIYSTLNAELNEVAMDAYGTEIQKLPLSEEHTNSDIVNGIIFKNGYLELGTKTYKCLYCDVTTNVEEAPSFPALFSFNGYSTPEDGDLAITVGYTIFQDAVKEYEAIMGNLEFGVVGAIYEKLGGLAPLAQSAAPVIKAQITEEYSSFDFVISGFTVEQMDLALVMCAYVYDGTKYVYLQEVQTENPTPVSINTILNA